MNSGKTTVSKVLEKKIPNTARLEVDALRHFISWMPVHDSVRYNLENTVSLIRNFVKNGFNVVVPYPLSPESYKYLNKELSDIETEVFYFTLNPSIKHLLLNRGTRELPKEDIEQINFLHAVKIAEVNFGITLDNSEQTPEETANIIIQSIKERTQ